MEATWKILAFPTHHRTTAVEKLPFHLPDQQLVVYNEDDPVDDVLTRLSIGINKFLGWMECNKIYPEARELTYSDFPSKFVWHQKEQQWKPRKKGFAIGRITYVPRSLGEVYYLRVLLNKVKGARSFEEIRTVNGILYPKFKDACYALGLLDDDKEYIEAIKESSLWATGASIRKLFVIMLLSSSVATPRTVWDATWEYLSEDVLFKQRRLRKNPSKLYILFI